MININAPPKEGDLYKTVKVDKYAFELRFGYYADFERHSGEPVVIYPDLVKRKLYAQSGEQIVTAVQDPCEHYQVHKNEVNNECCRDCVFYADPESELSICKCIHNINLIKGDVINEKV